MSRTDPHNLIREYQATRDPRLREQLVTPLSAARPQPRPALRQRRRAAGGPRAGRRPRAREGGRRLRRRARHGVLLLRGAEHRGRDQAPLPRPRVVGPRPARAAGARDARAPARERAERRARRGADGGRAGRGHARSAPRTCSRRAPPTARCTRARSTRPPRTPTATRRRWSRRWAATDDGYSTVLDRSALDSLLGGLDERDRAIVELYFREELTQSEIGERLGYSQMHISRLLRRAVGELEKAAA